MEILALIVTLVVLLIVTLIEIVLLLVLLLVLLAAIVTPLLVVVVPLAASPKACRLPPPRNAAGQRPAGLRPGRLWIEASAAAGAALGPPCGC